MAEQVMPSGSRSSTRSKPSSQASKTPKLERQDKAAFPLVQNNDAASYFSPGNPGFSNNKAAVEDENEDEPGVAKPSLYTSSPVPADDRTATETTEKREVRAENDQRLPDRHMHKMHKFSLYETASRFYIVGADVSENRYRVLKIDRTNAGTELNMTDDKMVYNIREMNQLLDTIDNGNKGTGGIKLRCTTWGLLGFIKFTGPYYMLLITKKSTVAMIGGHYIYQIEGTELVPLTTARYKPDSKNTEEQRFLAILNNLDLTKSFYYSYFYNVTRTLQDNISRERRALANGMLPPIDEEFNSMFVWNHHLLKPAINNLRDPYDWCRPIIHGYTDQAALSIYGRTAHITVIARRSRYFAGARFLKRGANDLGYVANDVETEQIVAESLTTSFHAPGPKLYCSPQYTSYVQHRGSIPLYWTQDNTGVTPKPPIELNLIDPFYGATALHFDNLFERYGAPIFVVNLVKSKERQPRESKLLDEYTLAIDYLNQFLPQDKKIVHKAWDMSRASKVRGGDVIGHLELIAESVLDSTGFFQNGDGETSSMSCQNGIARTNCIDCLDRTNAAQFVIGKRALGRQLHALGIIDDLSVEYDTDAVNLFTHMWHDHGDTIAVQYGGSQLVNTMETYRKINQWTSHSRDMIESFKRYYNNSFLDNQRQEAYNLFLGNYIFTQGQPMLWDLATDYYLHHADPRDWSARVKPDYINWYTPSFLRNRELLPFIPRQNSSRQQPIEFFDDYWLEYYRPSILSSFPKMFAYKMNSTIKYIPIKSTQDGRYDLSPFRVRTEETETDKRKTNRGHGYHGNRASATAAPQSPIPEDDTASITSGTTSHRAMTLGRWLHPVQDIVSGERDSLRKNILLNSNETDLSTEKAMQAEKSIAKSKAAQWSFAQAVRGSIDPLVSHQEEIDYDQYIRHPQNLPLVVSTETPVDIDATEYQEYVNGAWQSEGLMVTGTEEDIDIYAELLKVGENPLKVTEEDASKKRYKAYRKWLHGKSFFKPQSLD